MFIRGLHLIGYKNFKSPGTDCYNHTGGSEIWVKFLIEKNVNTTSSLNNIEQDMIYEKIYLQEFLCGWGAAVINVTVTYPINKVIFRQILEGIPANTAVQQISGEGIKLLYRGILPPLCQKTLSLSIMFSMYEGCKDRIYMITGNTVLATILAAKFAGTAEAILMPLERVQTLLQDWRYHNKFKNTSHAFQYLWRKSNQK
ncbi:hypothetical protein KM043_014240 [Ampulex compressa]|nr:hypothetical protein KM043_014240 [Ampulex compressa]